MISEKKAFAISIMLYGIYLAPMLLIELTPHTLKEHLEIGAQLFQGVYLKLYSSIITSLVFAQIMALMGQILLVIYYYRQER